METLAWEEVNSYQGSLSSYCPKSTDHGSNRFLSEGVSSHQTLGYCFAPGESHVPLETRFARFFAVHANNGAFALSAFKCMCLAINIQKNNVLSPTFSMLGKRLSVDSVKLINVPFPEFKKPLPGL